MDTNMRAHIDMRRTGERIKALMAERGFTVDDLMQITGITTKQGIYRWLRGETLPSLENMLAISRAMELDSIEELLVVEYRHTK
ncbi:MAG: helix-turn-helix transcriptional regulator [Mogibacterium sp.]|nr:helix-turn-helix transcriptional regulator [Mogibacterium sp.]